MKTIFTYRSGCRVGLALLFIFAASFVSAQTKYIVQATNTVFTPDELTINVGDTVEWQNIAGWHNVNGTQATFPNNPESFGNAQGSGWTYRHVFQTAGHYDYHCDPHASLGMTGKIEVTTAVDSGIYVLTLNLNSMTPHVGQMLYLSVIDKESGMELARMKELISANFSIQVPGIEKNHSYFVNFFADFNSNGKYDMPPTDHAWQLQLNDVSGNSTLDFTHNTGFTDIKWQNLLTVNFMSMNPHVGQMFYFWVKEQGTGTELFDTTLTVSAAFTIKVYGIVIGKSYNVDFYADFNNNGTYNAPPVDHAWRLSLNNVAGDTVLNFTHNTSFTNIFDATAVNELSDGAFLMYPNPAVDVLRLEFAKPAGQITVGIIDLMGRQQRIDRQVSGNSLDLNVATLPRGIYLVQVEDGGELRTRKLVKQ